MLCNAPDADCNVLVLIGERGREVREFIDFTLSEETRKRCVIVVATSDRPALERVRALFVATTIAEFFRDNGKRVVLLADSLTRYARGRTGNRSGRRRDRGFWRISAAYLVHCHDF